MWRDRRSAARGVAAAARSNVYEDAHHADKGSVMENVRAKMPGTPLNQPEATAHAENTARKAGLSAKKISRISSKATRKAGEDAWRDIQHDPANNPFRANRPNTRLARKADRKEIKAAGRAAQQRLF